MDKCYISIGYVRKLICWGLRDRVVIRELIRLAYSMD
jgi:hypothetical protein